MYSRQWILYSLIRVGVFTVALAVCLIVGMNVFLATIVAAVIGFCISFIFLGKQRQAVSTSIDHLRTTKSRDVDNEIENEALDRFDSER